MADKNQPLAIPFFALVFGLSIPFWILGFMNPIQILPGLPISALGAFAPLFGTLILAYKNDRASGVLQILKRSFDFRNIKNKNWFLVILLINPVIAVLAYGIISMAGNQLPSPAPLTLAVLALFVFFFLALWQRKSAGQVTPPSLYKIIGDRSFQA